MNRRRVTAFFAVSQRRAIPPRPRKQQSTVDGIVALLRGEPKDLNYVTIDTEGVADFNRRVYAVARTIGAGATLSYGEIAERLGDRNLAPGMRAGNFARSVPAYRAVSSRAGGRRQDGRIFRAWRRSHQAAASYRSRARNPASPCCSTGCR